jgi:hypothetical protein
MIIIDTSAHAMVQLNLQSSNGIDISERPTNSVRFIWLRISQDDVGGHVLSVPSGWQTPNGEQPYHATIANSLSLATIVVPPAPYPVQFLSGEFQSQSVPIGIVPEGPGTGWTPLDLGTDLKAWWAADDAPDGAFTTIIDRVAAQTLTSEGGVMSIANGWDGERTIYFDGVNDDLVTTNLAGIPTGTAESEIWSLYDILNPPDGPANKMICSYGGLAVATTRQSRVSVASFAAVSNGQVALTDTAMELRGRHAMSASFEFVSASQSLLSGSVDGWKMIPATLTAAALNTGATRLRVGASNGTTANQFANMHLKHLMITAKLTTANRRRMQGWLCWDGGIQAKLPANHPYRNSPP